jgi:hypothetical protein
VIVGTIGTFTIHREGERVREGGDGRRWWCEAADGTVHGEKGTDGCGHLFDPDPAIGFFAAVREKRLPDRMVLSPEGEAAARECECLAGAPLTERERVEPPPPAAEGERSADRRKARRAWKIWAYQVKQAQERAAEAAEAARQAETAADAWLAARAAEDAAAEARAIAAEAAAAAEAAEVEDQLEAERHAEELARAARQATRTARKATETAQIDAILEGVRAKDEARKRAHREATARWRAKRKGKK